MESGIMIDSQVIVASLAAAGSVGAGTIAVIKTIYSRMSDRADRSDVKVAMLHEDLLDCEKKHNETSERIGKLEGWREGFADGKAAESKPLTRTDTA